MTADRLTVVAAPTGEAFPYGSCVRRAARPEQCIGGGELEVTDWGALVKTTRSGAAGATVSTWVGFGAMPAAEAVTVTLPAAVARKEKGALLAPAATTTDVTGAPVQPEPA